MPNFIAAKQAQFVTLEGGEGSGKSTQAKLLLGYLEQSGIPAIQTREIGGSKEAEQIRELIFSNKLLNVSEILLVMAARYEHVENVVKPALNQNKWVVCDRYFDSTIAYQGDQENIDMIHELHKTILKNFLPDLTILIDIDPSIGLERAKQRGELNKFDKYDLNYHNKIRDSFLDSARKNPARIKIIDGNQNIHNMHQQIISILHI